MTTAAPRFASLVLDVDSTLCGVEGVDWLARLRSPEVARKTELLTERAMNGEIPLDAIYGERLEIIRPTRDEVAALSEVYRKELAAGAPQAIARLREAGVRVVLITGGLRPAIAAVARDLECELHAVDIRWSAEGAYEGHDAASPLTTQTGKPMVLQTLALPRPILAVGDGSTDLGMRAVADAFVAFAGFVTREAVARAADHVVRTFAELEQYVLGSVAT